MRLNSIYKNCSRAARRLSFFAIRWITARLPYALFRHFSPFFIALGRFFFRKKRKVAYENLCFVFLGQKSAQEITGMVEAYFNRVCRGMVDFIYFLDRPKEILRKVRIEGQQHLEKALAKGQGAIMLSAHFGSFGLMFLRLALAGWKTNFIIRPMRDKHMSDFISGYAAQRGIRTIYALPLRQCVEESLKVLKNNELLFILLDQNYSQEAAVVVDFLGRPAATATGPVIFAARSQAPILPVFITGDFERGYRIDINPPVFFDTPRPTNRSPEDRDKNWPLGHVVCEAEFASGGSSPGGLHLNARDLDVKFRTAELIRIIEDNIRQSPHEWGGWMHRRWKVKVEEENQDVQFARHRD